MSCCLSFYDFINVHTCVLLFANKSQPAKSIFKNHSNLYALNHTHYTHTWWFVYACIHVAVHIMVVFYNAIYIIRICNKKSASFFTVYYFCFDELRYFAPSTSVQSICICWRMLSEKERSLTHSLSINRLAAKHLWNSSSGCIVSNHNTIIIQNVIMLLFFTSNARVHLKWNIGSTFVVQTIWFASQQIRLTCWWMTQRLVKNKQCSVMGKRNGICTIFSWELLNFWHGLLDWFRHKLTADDFKLENWHKNRQI